jgi:hypothetical protein
MENTRMPINRGRGGGAVNKWTSWLRVQMHWQGVELDSTRRIGHHHFARGRTKEYPDPRQDEWAEGDMTGG